MKILMTMVAALAISSVASAQQTACTFTTDGVSETRTFDGLARIVNIEGANAVNVVNRRTGEILDTVEFGNARFGVRCNIAGSSSSPAPSVVAPSSPTEPSASSAINQATAESTPARRISRFSRLRRRSRG